MTWISLPTYLALLAGAGLCHGLARLVRIPALALALGAGLAIGRTGFDLVPATTLRDLYPGVTVHVAVVLGVLGHRLGLGMLREPPARIARRLVIPLAGAALALALAAVLLPLALPGAEPSRAYHRFHLPLALVLAVLPLLAMRDLRNRLPARTGSHFLVAILIVGCVVSFAPVLLWQPRLDPGTLWRVPALVLGESGALGAGLGVLYLALARRLRMPKLLALALVSVALFGLAFRYRLWPPFAALGSGIALGRAGEAIRLPRLLGRTSLLETPFALAAGAAFAPDLFRDAVGGPALVFAAALGAAFLVLRARWPGGRGLFTGPGLLFLGFSLSIRLDPRMSPMSRYLLDFALPAWILVHLLARTVERRERGPDLRESESGHRGPEAGTGGATA